MPDLRHPLAGQARTIRDPVRAGLPEVWQQILALDEREGVEKMSESDTAIHLIAWLTIFVFGLLTFYCMISSKDEGFFKSATIVLLACLVLVLQGCASVTPYAAIRHIDPTPAQGGDDAWDVGCAGIKKRGQLSLQAGWCENLRGGGMLEASIEYDFRGSDQ